MTKHPEQQQRDLRQQRTNAVRTAWVLAIVAILIFAAFVLSGLFGETPGT